MGIQATTTTRRSWCRHRGLGYGGLGYGGLGYGGLGYGGWGYGVPGYFGSSLTTYPLGLPLVQPTIALQSPGVYTPFWSNNPLVNGGLINTGNLWQQQVPDALTPRVEHARY